MPQHGTLMGNRGGKFHRDDKSLRARRWASRRWITCETEFRNRHRDVWGRGYTELFFLDEVTSLAAGHRPCFECRRLEAKAFCDGMKPDEVDRLLHEQRLAVMGLMHPASQGPLSPSDSSPNKLRERDSKRRSYLPSALLGEVPEGRRGPPSTAALPAAEIPDGAMIAWHGKFYARRNTRFLCWSFDGYSLGDAPSDHDSVTLLTPPFTTARLVAGYQPRWHSSAQQWDN